MKEKRRNKVVKHLGAKLPIRIEHYRRMRRLIRGGSVHQQARNLLLINFQINSSLRAGDLLRLEVGDVFDGERFYDEFFLRQEKTGQTAAVKILPCMLKDLLLAKEAYGEVFYDYFADLERPLFPSRQREKGKVRPLSYSAYFALIKRLVIDLGLNPKQYATHSLRSTIPQLHYEATNDILGASKLFGHKRISTTTIYLEDVAKMKASHLRERLFFDD